MHDLLHRSVYLFGDIGNKAINSFHIFHHLSKSVHNPGRQKVNYTGAENAPAKAIICCVVDPELVVLGGGVSKAGQPLLDGARRYFDEYIFHAATSTRFALASLGNDAGAYGAFKMVLDAAAN